MKNFDLEAAKRGAAVRTECGAPVEIITFNARSFTYPILGYAGRTGRIRKFMKDGKSADSPFNDLMMRDDDYLEKLERGEYQSGQIRPLYENPSNSMPLNLTKREWFAGMAMQGEISGYLAAGNGFDGDKSISGIIAKGSVMIADALIEELEKTEK